MAYEQKHIEGDAVVGHDAVVGGDLKVNGRGHFKGNVRIDGWLDCPNIAGPHKGFFSTETELRSAHPSPQEGWVAVVGDNPPAGKVYRVNKGQWTNTNTDSTGSLDGDVNAYSKQVVALASGLQELSAKLSHATVTQVAPLYDNNGNLVIETEKSDGTYEEIAIPKSTTEKDGIMSAADKERLDESVAMATPLTGEDGSCILEIERNNGTYIEFPFPKAGEGNDGMMSKEDKQSLAHLPHAIEQEQERAVAEEERLSQRIDRSEEKDKELCLAIKQEQTRAESAEKINANAISAEEKRATNAECHLGHGVTEAHRRIDEILQRYARPSSLEQELKDTQKELEEAKNDIAALQDEVSDLPEIRKNIEKSQKDIEILYRGTQDLPEIRKDLSKAKEDIELGKKERQSIRKTVESIAAAGGSGGGGASVATAVYFDNENTTLYGANVQDAVEELSSKVDSAVSNVIPTTNDNGDCVLGVETFGHGEDPEYQELPMPKASSYNDGVMSKEDSKLLHDMKQAAIADHNAMYPLEVQISGVSNPYEEGEENQIQINLEALHKGEALSEGVKFTVNGKEVNEQPYTLVATRSVNVPVSAEYAGYAYLGEELTLRKDVTLKIVCVKPCYIGGNRFEDINFEDHVNESDGFAKYIKTSPAGTYTIGLEEAGYIWMCVPLEMAVSKVTSSGFDVPVTEYRKPDLNNNVYRCYRSDNKLVAGNYTITIS